MNWKYLVWSKYKEYVFMQAESKKPSFSSSSSNKCLCCDCQFWKIFCCYYRNFCVWYECCENIRKAFSVHFWTSLSRFGGLWKHVLIRRQTQILSSGQVDQIKSYKTQGIKWYYANHSKDMQRFGVAKRVEKQTQIKQRASPLHRWALGWQSLVEVRCCWSGWGEAWGDGASTTNAALCVTLPGTFFSALMRKKCVLTCSKIRSGGRQ